MTTKKAEYIYVLRSGATGCFKIGRTTGPRRRIEQIQRDSAFPIELVSLYACEGSAAIEREIHISFKDFREHGEWFKIEESDLCNIPRKGMELVRLSEIDAPMQKTKHTSIRIPDELLEMIDSEAKRRRWSRHAAIITCIEFGLPDLERDGLLGRNNSEKENSGADRGVRAVAGEKESSGKENPSVAKKGGAIKSKGVNIGKAGSGASAVVVTWFPTEMCPHGYQNSFACEKNSGGCAR